MCDHHTSPVSISQTRLGSRLEHGQAHTEDHRLWSRRTFLSTMGLTGVGSVFMLGQSPVEAFGLTPLLAPLGGIETDRILVLIQLDGGNDGLNMLGFRFGAPVANTFDTYHPVR